MVQHKQPPQARLLYGYGTSSILSNIKNATGNIAGTLDDCGSASDENKNMYRESNETSDFATILISHQSDKTTQENQTNIILNGKWIS